MTNPSGKITGTLLQTSGGSFPRRSPGSVLRENPKRTSDLPRLGRRELIRETQKIVLAVPLKQAAAEQDTTERAVESQRNGESAMSLLAAVNMARSNPAARAEFARLFGIPGYFNDPAFMEAWERFGEFYARQRDMAETGPEMACDEAMGDLFGGTHARH